MEMLGILNEGVKLGASDVHIVPERPPMIRIKGRLQPIPNTETLTTEQAKALVYSILYEEQKQKFEENLELDCSFDVPSLSRFRVNIYVTKNGVCAALRVIPSEIPTPEDLNLPQVVIELTDLPRGLVLVTGPTGSGKSTTLASLINIINAKREEHILTIEDPIEYIYKMKSCLVNQREVGMHSHSFQNALKYALRQDPDVILVGEMRDLETISLAMTLAETGHVVFATLHTTDAPQTVDRIVDIFPPFQQTQVRVQLSVCLKAVICQQLLPRRDGTGRVAAREIMIVSPAIANLIREGKTHQIYGAIDTGAKFGMISMDKHLSELVKKQVIDQELALAKANKPDLLRTFLGIGAGGEWRGGGKGYAY
ncbi:TPA: type IV pili twitching motility protein PilT [bacterium]|nr:type IV pili twitching motility protein PilT [bacterium]